MKKFFKGFLLAVITLSLMVAAYGCGADKTAKTEGDKKEEKQKVVFASDTAYAPFEYQDEKTGEYVGFDMDLIKAIGDAEGLEVEIKSMSFDGVLGSVESGNVDGAISAITITDERKQKFDFSNPYFDADQSIAVREDNTDIKDQASLEGKTIAVQIATTGAKLAKSIKGTKVKEFNTIGDAFMELKNGGADAVVNDIPVTADYLKKTGEGLKLVGIVKTGEQYGIGVTKGNSELVAKINEGLKKVKDNGEYDKIYKKWFSAEK